LLLLNAIACKPASNVSIFHQLNQSQIQANLVIHDEDLIHIDPSSLTAYLRCTGQKDDIKAKIDHNEQAAIEQIQFKMDQELATGTPCLIEIHGSPSLEAQVEEHYQFLWLTHEKRENLLFISKPAPLMAFQDREADGDQGYLTTIFFKTYRVMEQSSEQISSLSAQVSIAEGSEVQNATD
jgi:hypothetical protein